MRCVVGLGNPGPRFSQSRHNVGFQFIERLSQASGIRLPRRSHGVTWGEGVWYGERLALARPLTYMNLSGPGVKALIREGDCSIPSLLVVHDDLDLELGRLKFKEGGGDGGHRGVRSIVEALGDNRFLRLRVGVGRPPAGTEERDYVLEAFGADEREAVDAVLNRAVDALKMLIVSGLEEAMNQYHSRSDTQT
jgi:peptidyl-tRNA hydrolase, PTH1 family